jgi:hypothetical protein
MRKIINLISFQDAPMLNESKNKREQLMLDRPTSHGGWPAGKNNSWIGDKPVNDIIYDYLESMGLTADVPHAKLSENKVKKLIIESIKRHVK